MQGLHLAHLLCTKFWYFFLTTLHSLSSFDFDIHKGLFNTFTISCSNCSNIYMDPMTFMQKIPPMFDKDERTVSEECNYTEFTLQFHWKLFYTWILLFYSRILQNLISEREGKVFLIQIHDLSFRHFFRNRRDKNALAWSPHRKYLADRNFWSTKPSHFNRSCFKSRDFLRFRKEE